MSITVRCLVVVICIFCFTGSPPVARTAHADWLEDWSFRRPVEISNPCGEAVDFHQVLLVLDSATGAEPDGSDLRVTESDGSTLLPFWIEDWDAGTSSGVVWVQIPSLPVEGTTVYLYYGKPGAGALSDGGGTFAAYDGMEGYDVGTVPAGSAGNPGEWSRHPGNPMISEGAPDEWDDHGATYASVIQDDEAGEFRMYYHGFSFTNVHQIGLATSPDGLNWTKYAGNPILTPGPAAWDNQSVRVPVVWKEGPADYRMIYTGNGVGGMQVGYATSTDGISWTKHAGNPVFNDPTWANGQTQNWGIMKVGAEYLMWYGNFGVREQGIAVSTDLVNWTPYQADPIFASSGDPLDDRYSQYCPFSFTYGGEYYVLVPSYTAAGNFGKFYLYRSSSPYFPEADRTLVRVACTVGAAGEWDDNDTCTPFVLTLDIERSQFYNDELWVYYSAEEGSNLWGEGLLLESDIAAALAPADLPSEELSWTTAGDVTVTDTPVRQGVRSAWQHDTSATAATQLNGAFNGLDNGAVGAWTYRSDSSAGDYDVYLYSGATLAAAAGLGRDGDFHYWDGDFNATGVAWDPGTWYLVTLYFDSAADTYDFVVSDDQSSELLHIEDIAFGNPAGMIDSAVLYTSSGFLEEGYADDFRVFRWCGETIPGIVGDEEQMPADTTVTVRMGCTPTLGTVPFTAKMDVTLGNTYSGLTRRIAAHVDAGLAGGQQYSNWKSGWSNIDAGSEILRTWNQNIPALGSVIGDNIFQIFAEDVTPSPYNQPPHPPSGDTDTDVCTITGVTP